MPPIFFTNIWMLAGLAGLAIPILIHLLLKRKKKRLRFSTLQFLFRHDQQSSKRRKLRHWLLLALRLLIFTLLVLAFARPYRPQSASAAAGRKRRQAIFILDRSASMQAGATGGERWRQAAERVKKALSEFTADDRAALIGCAGHSDLISGFAPPASIAKLLAELQPGYGVANLSEGLRQAGKLLAASDPRLASTIYLVSDLQRSGCQNLGSAPLPEGVEVKLLNVGDLLSPNVALTQLQIETEDAGRPKAVAVNFSDEESGPLTLEFSVDGKSSFSRALSLPAGSSTNLELGLPALAPGWHDLKAAVRTKDSFHLDDTRYDSIFIPEPLRVLIVETRKAKHPFEEESFFLTTALDPASDATNSVQTAYRITKTTPEELAGKLSVKAETLPCDLVMLPGLKLVPAGLGKSLSAFVQAGGGLVLFLGDGISANRYQNEFRDLLPAALGLPEKPADPAFGWRMGEFETNSAVLSPFRLPNSGDLHIPEFSRRQALTAVEGASTVMRFEDDIPLLLTRPAGKGRVALINSSADTSWTDWPKHKTFVPWLHALGKYLAPKGGLNQTQTSNSFLAGDEFEIELGRAARKASFRLTSPNGKEASVSADDEGRLRSPESAMPGIYLLRDPAGREIRRFAINVPAEESDLAAISPAEFTQQLVRVPEPRNTTLRAGLFGGSRDQQEFWRLLLLGVLALLFIEVFLANKTIA